MDPWIPRGPEVTLVTLCALAWPAGQGALELLKVRTCTSVLIYIN
jgi:hypothetical protein